MPVGDPEQLAWSPGARVGPYEILGRLGEGGMGEVYRARDTRLGREVAIKTSREQFSSRFQREARAISALNDPHICALYDIGPNYLVMELVAGQTLASRLEQGRLSMDLVLRYGAQIAAALSAAHDKGIVHRDLKPANIMVTRTGVKVLDFGLAKFEESAAAAAAEADTATVSQVMLGTPAYMAPEQVECKPSDSRTDIFALGLVLYEMAAGKRAFAGASRAALGADILRSDPPPIPGVSPSFAFLVERCLAKDPESRWQSARDVQTLLQYQERAAPAPPAPATAPRKRIWSVAVGAVVALSALAAAGLYFRTGHADLAVTPLTSFPGSEVTPSLSPDGTRVAFAWNGGDGNNFDIYVKQIGPGDPVRLTKDPAEEAMARWSPDGNWIAFLRRKGGDLGSVYLIPALGGMERKVADDVLFVTNGGYWGTWFDSLDWSPDGRLLVVAKRASPGAPTLLYLVTVDSGELKLLAPGAATANPSSATFAPDGHALAFWKADVGLMVLPLAPSLEAAGPPREIPLGARKPTAMPSLCWTSDSRDILFSVGARENSAIWRVSAAGGAAPQPLAFLGDGATAPAVSRGGRIVFPRYEKEFNIWSLELDGAGRAVGPAVRAFDSTKSEISPEFSPDGKKVAFASGRSGNDEIWVCLSDGSSCSQLTSLAGPQVGSPAWSPDGNWIAYDVFRAAGAIEIVPSGGGKPRTLAAGLLPLWSNDGESIYYWCLPPRETCVIPSKGGPFRKILDSSGQVQESPDGKWLYYSAANVSTPGSLWRMPLSGGPAAEMFAISGRNFVVVEGGIWYLTPNTSEGSLLQYYDLSAKSTRTVYRTTRPVYAGMTLTPDHRRILFTQMDRPPNHDLMLVENFH